MGWQDAPALDSGGGWQSAPAVDEPMVAPSEPEQNFIADRVFKAVDRSPIGFVADIYKRGMRGELITPEEESKLRGLTMGAADPSVGIAQFVANKLGFGEPVNRAIAGKEAEYQAGREAVGREGFDAFRMAGNVGVSALPVAAVTKAAPVVTAFERARQGAGIGGAMGLATPVTDVQDAEDYEKTKIKQELIGMGLGAAIPVGTDLTLGMLRSIKNLIKPHFSQQAVTQTAGRVARDVAGDRADDVVASLERAKQGQTAGEGAVGAGSAEFEGLQRLARQSAPSEYMDLAAQQQALAGAEKQALGVTTASLRSKALESANANGVRSENVISNIDAQLSEKGVRASDVVQKTLGGIKDKIAALTNENGVIDANDLYTVRKEVGNSIATFSKETSNWDKRLTSSLERKIQGAIDDAIEKAGGRGWKQYLSEYSKGIQDISSRDVATKTARKMEVAGASKAREIAGADEVPISIPNVLSRPVMIINAVLRRAQGVGSEKTTAEIARLMQNPREMAAVMKAATPSERAELMKVLAGRGLYMAGTQAAAREVGAE